MSQQKSTIGFLSLPLTARLRIYDLALVREPQILLQCKPVIENLPISSNLLRTCKQICNEASPTLYSKNKFLVCEPELVHRWLLEIGPVNIKLLKSIRIWVEANLFDGLFDFNFRRYAGKKLSLWYKLLNKLAADATELQHIFIYWDAEITDSLYGAVRDLRFVRELAKIQGLQSMVISGYYAKHWPSYLVAQMGCSVHEDVNWQFLSEYQQGTEDLKP